MKYIIEIEDKPFVRLSALFGEEGLYRAKGFNSLVFDQFGLDKLTPLDKELEEAYQKGKHDAEQDLARAAYEEAYQKGYEVGQHEATTLEYQQGLNDAWECMKAIAFLNKPRDMRDFFGCSTLGDVLIDYTASEAIEKLKAYEESQKADGIKVGDEVKDRTDDCGVVTWIYGNDAYVLWHDGSTGNYAADELIKTGRHFNFLASLLNAMKEGAE